MGEQGHDEGHGLCRGAQPIEGRAFGGAERLVTRVTDEPLLLLRMDTDIALAGLASGRARESGAEYRGGVHDDFSSLGCAGEHAKKKYVWTPVSFATSLYHGWVWSYLYFFASCIHQIDV